MSFASKVSILAVVASCWATVAQAQEPAKDWRATGVEMLSVPEKHGLRCFPPKDRNADTLLLVFETGASGPDSREMRLEVGARNRILSVSDIQWARRKSGITVMYTAVAVWSDSSAGGRLVEMPMSVDKADGSARARLLNEKEMKVAKLLANWLLAERCDVMPDR